MKAYQVHHPYPEHNCSLPCRDSNANVMKNSCSTNQVTKNMNIVQAGEQEKHQKVASNYPQGHTGPSAKVLPPSHSLGSSCLAVCWPQALSDSQFSLIVFRAGWACQSAIHILCEEAHCTWHFSYFQPQPPKQYIFCLEGNQRTNWAWAEPISAFTGIAC